VHPIGPTALHTRKEVAEERTNFVYIGVLKGTGKKGRGGSLRHFQLFFGGQEVVYKFRFPTSRFFVDHFPLLSVYTMAASDKDT